MLKMSLEVRSHIILSSLIGLIGIKVDVIRFMMLLGALKEREDVFHSPLLKMVATLVVCSFKVSGSSIMFWMKLLFGIQSSFKKLTLSDLLTTHLEACLHISQPLKMHCQIEDFAFLGM